EQEFQRQLDMSREINEKMFGKAATQDLPDAMTMKHMSMGMAGGGSLLGLLASGIMIVGGMRMRQCRSYALAMTASIVAIVPCITCAGCCGAGQGVGIWAVVVLLKPEVQALFRSPTQGSSGSLPI